MLLSWHQALDIYKNIFNLKPIDFLSEVRNKSESVSVYNLQFLPRTLYQSCKFTYTPSAVTHCIYLTSCG